MAFRNTGTGNRRVVLRIALAVGYLALAAAVLAADAHEAVAYELSIYAGTPLAFWLGTGFALSLALVVSFLAPPGWLRTGALSLGGLAVAAIVGLPVLREYFFHGTADALTHLGWVRDVATGTTAPAELFYPGIHSVAVVIASVTGIALERALLLTIATIAIVALVFVPLLVRTIARGDRAVVIGAFSVFLLFFVHNLGIYLHAHAFAQATFFSALVLFLALVYVTRSSGRAIGALLAIASIAVLLYHPQQAANLIFVFVAISLVQLYHRRKRTESVVTSHRPLYAHTGLLVVAFGLWITRFEGWAFTNIGRIQDAFFGYLEGRPPTAGEPVQAQATSLTQIGSGLPEIFVKLFLVAAIFSALAGVLMLASMLGRADDSRPTANAVALYFGVASLLAVPLIVAYFVGNIAEHYFRHIGFLLLIAAIVGALALVRIVDRVSGRFDRRTATFAIALGFAVLLPLSLATAYPSPFMYKQTQHVTEPQMDGYATVFDVNDPSLTLAGVRGGPWRFHDAIQGVAARTHYEADVSSENISALGSHFADGGYVTLTEYDRQREVDAYREVRYSARLLGSLDAQPGVNRVVANEALRLYHVPEGGG